MRNRNRLSILSNACAADIHLEPYPHLVLEDALDADVFSRLASTFPSDETIANGREILDTWFDYPACKVVKDDRIDLLWREFFQYHTSAEFFRDLVNLSADTLRRINPDIEQRVGRSLLDFNVGMRPGGRGDPLAPGADVSMECQFYANYTRGPRTVRGPHVDRPSELFAALLYFRQAADDSVGGDLEICEAVKPIYPETDTIRISQLPAEVSPQAVRTFRTAKYQPNTLVLFLNSPRSIHAVTPRSPTPLTRRHINFCCDLPFDLFHIQLPPRLTIKKRLESVPLAWRLAKHL